MLIILTFERLTYRIFIRAEKKLDIRTMFTLVREGQYVYGFHYVADG